MNDPKHEGGNANTAESQVGSAASVELKSLIRRYISFPVVLAAFACTAVVGAVASADLKDSMNRANRESAYLRVMRSQVPVNGDQGTSEWRAMYAEGLKRALGQFDFTKSCTWNGFPRQQPSAETLPCLVAGAVTVVRQKDGSLAYFAGAEHSGRMVPLDVREQDVHADDYVDIDLLMRAVREQG